MRTPERNLIPKKIFSLGSRISFQPYRGRQLTGSENAVCLRKSAHEYEVRRFTTKWDRCGRWVELHERAHKSCFVTKWGHNATLFAFSISFTGTFLCVRVCTIVLSVNYNYEPGWHLLVECQNQFSVLFWHLLTFSGGFVLVFHCLCFNVYIVLRLFA